MSDIVEGTSFSQAKVGGVPFAVTDMESAVGWEISRATDRRSSPMPIRLSNAWSVVVAHEDPVYRAVLEGPGVNLPDGTPIVWFLRAAGASEAGRVRGPSFFEQVIDKGRPWGVRHYLLGGTGESLVKLRAEIHNRYPGAIVAGAYSPPFAPLDEANLADWAERIGQAAADIVWIGLGTPKQDIAAARLVERVGVDCIGVGAAFDFMAGSVAEAPRWMQDSGLEWCHRLMSEPGRLWRRYLIGNAKFLRIATERLLRDH